MIRLRGDEQVVTSVKALNKTTNEEFEIQLQVSSFVATGLEINTDILRHHRWKQVYIINVVGTAKQIAGVLYPECCRSCLSSSNYHTAGTGCMAA
jgi:thioredoxin reductase (NADPH)